jgi:hypothetical protein
MTDFTRRLDGMPAYSPKSLRYEYDLYVEQEIEYYKDSIPRGALLRIGDEAVSTLRQQEQTSFDEILVWAEVDRIIRNRLRVPSFATWKRRRLRRLEEYRRRPAGHGDPRARACPRAGRGRQSRGSGNLPRGKWLSGDRAR